VFVQFKILLLVHVDGARRCLRTAATNRPFVHPSDIGYEYGELQWNNIDRRKTEELGEKPVTCANLLTTNPTGTDLGANPVPRGEKLSNNRVGHGTACPKPYIHQDPLRLQ
jgi:hypothetical protein